MRITYDIRLAMSDDLDELLKIEEECRAEREILSEEQLAQICCLDVGPISYVARLREGESKILGFIVFELHSGRIQVTHVAVRPSCRNGGVGRALLQRVISNLTLYRRSKVRMCVPLGYMNVLKWIRACQFGFQSSLEGDTVIFLHTIVEGANLPLQGAVE